MDKQAAGIYIRIPFPLKKFPAQFYVIHLHHLPHNRYIMPSIFPMALSQAIHNYFFDGIRPEDGSWHSVSPVRLQHIYPIVPGVLPLYGFLEGLQHQHHRKLRSIAALFYNPCIRSCVKSSLLPVLRFSLSFCCSA